MPAEYSLRGRVPAADEALRVPLDPCEGASHKGLLEPVVSGSQLVGLVFQLLLGAKLVADVADDPAHGGRLPIRPRNEEDCRMAVQGGAVFPAIVAGALPEALRHEILE